MIKKVEYGIRILFVDITLNDTKVNFQLPRGLFPWGIFQGQSFRVQFNEWQISRGRFSSHGQVKHTLIWFVYSTESRERSGFMNPFFATSLSIPPENTRKHLFYDVYKGIPFERDQRHEMG